MTPGLLAGAPRDSPPVLEAALGAGRIEPHHAVVGPYRVDPADAELWQRLDQALARHQVSWHWVKGHAGHDDNERADELARMGMAPFKKPSRSR